MGYVAVSGGRQAIENAEKYLNLSRLQADKSSMDIEQIKKGLHFLVDRVMGEGSLYAPGLAALAIKQSAGDTFEAAFIIRAYRTTLPRLGYTISSNTNEMRIIRRISSAFKDIPGGQVLGPTSDYTMRLLNFTLLDENPDEFRGICDDLLKSAGITGELPVSFPKVVEILRKEKLVVPRMRQESIEQDCFDITRDSLEFPASRSASMQTMARGETGGMLALAYSNMRGYGSAHPTIGELRVGYLPAWINHPYRKEPYYIGEVLVTEAEILSDITMDDGKPRFALGYGLCFGHNETKAISMATLDRAMQEDHPKYPSEDSEFVLSHIDGIESMGFANHFKLPHYVTFQSSLDRLRKIKKSGKGSGEVENEF